MRLPGEGRKQASKHHHHHHAQVEALEEQTLASRRRQNTKSSQNGERSSFFITRAKKTIYWGVFFLSVKDYLFGLLPTKGQRRKYYCV
jgi:hypothetical protein